MLELINWIVIFCQLSLGNTTHVLPFPLHFTYANVLSTCVLWVTFVWSYIKLQRGVNDTETCGVIMEEFVMEEEVIMEGDECGVLNTGIGVSTYDIYVLLFFVFRLMNKQHE